MKRNNKNLVARNRYVLVAVCIVLLAAVYFISAKTFHWWPLQKSTSQNSNSLPSPKPKNPSPKNNAATTKGDTQPSVDPGKTSDQVPISTTMVASITTLKESGQEVQFAGSVTNSPTVGTCVVTFSNPNDRPVTKQVDATETNGTASCGPLSIPANEFSYLGTWQVTFHYYLGSQQATAQGNIQIQ